MGDELGRGYSRKKNVTTLRATRGLCKLLKAQIPWEVSYFELFFLGSLAGTMYMIGG